MMRIVALNEDELSDSDSEEEIAVTAEAQETIAESEYMRAIKLKAQGKTDATLSLLTELLDTKVLNELLTDNENEKLWAIRYNCHKNIAIIYEEKGEYEKALQHFVLAMQIDETDVYTLNRFGKLALKNNALELAECAFEKCLHRNPLHYGAADSMLEILCRNQNILGAFGWALKLYRRDLHHKHAERTLREICTRFKHLISFYENFWGPVPENIFEREWCQEKDGSVFPEPKEMILEDERLKVHVPTDIDKFRIKLPSWHSVGRYIMDVYSHLEETKQSMLFAWKYPEIICDPSNQNECVEKMDTTVACSVAENENSNNSNSSPSEAGGIVENSNTCQQDGKYDGEVYSLSPKPSIFATPPLTTAADLNAGEKTPNHENNSDANEDSKSDSSDASKPKPRRRCSDLHFLEQWGWHKNRRYSSRKKPQPERSEVDTTLNGYLRKMFSKYMSTAWQTEWPFNIDLTCESNKNDKNIEINIDELDCLKCKREKSLEEFQIETQHVFDCLIDKIKVRHFDLMLLIYKWLKYMALCWQTSMPTELKMLYMDIFNLYMRHFDFNTWNQLNDNNFMASYRICLLFLELDYCGKVKEGSEISMDWKTIFNQLMFKSGTAYVILNAKFEPYKLRLANLEYLWCSYGAQYEKCVMCLENMEEIVNNQTENYILHIPNLEEGCITKKIITKTRKDFQRQIALKTVPKLFREEQWLKLIDIIKENIRQSKDNYKCENWIKDIKVQIEILLQALWSINALEECLVYAEKFIHYCTCRYLHENKFSSRQKQWSESINYIFSYIEALILNEGFEIVSHLGDKISRLVQNIVRILSYQLDAPIDKNNNSIHELETKRLWVVLHQVMLRDENNSPVVIKNKVNETDEEEENIPSSYLVLFTAHEFLGKRQWCTNDSGGILQYTLDAVAPNLRAPLYDVCRDAVYEYIEQVTFCLYGYPQKKARSKHLEDHEANMIELTWPKAIQLFDLYRPESLPEFNSYKLESISADMEQLLLKILGLMPVELDPTPLTTQIIDFINGTSNELPDESASSKLPFKICTIFYLLGDYYFKSRDFSKAIKYFTLDLACSPARFDAWAGVALSKASKIETKLNGLTPIDITTLMKESEEVIRCFERCISLNRNQILLWIEYGSFAYTLHAFCSRYLKQNADKLSIEEFSSAEGHKEKMLQIALNCFTLASSLQNTVVECLDDNGELHDEKWLCQYMLGKIAEKRKEQPKVYLNYYLTAANFLYESNATYPIKINHSNPTTLSVEALEVFYRTNSAIIKFLESTKEINREIGDLFNSVLRNLSNSPFAFNKAKIDGNSLNAFKRKIADKMEQASSPKISKETNDEKTASPIVVVKKETITSNDEATPMSSTFTENLENKLKSESTGNVETAEAVTKTSEPQNTVSPTRRESQESTVTITTTTVTSSTTSSSSSSDSSSSDSDSDSDETSTEAESKKDKNAPYSASELKNIYSIVVQNLEECITRFPEHYKSIYRLVYHYMNGPPELCDLRKCEQLLLSQYRTSLGNQINGLFYDRKYNNIFNGIWRIPSSEIDRPGSFSAHLVKCVGLLERVLMKCNNFQLLIDIGLQLHKTPDNDKRYIKDNDRMELYRQSILLSGQVMRSLLKTCMEKRNDEETLNLLIDIYKNHKKCIKQINQKENLFVQLLIDVYKFFIKNKVEIIPENLNFYDLAVKLCIQETTARKNLEKSLNSSGSRNTNANISDVMLGINSDTSLNSSMSQRPIQIPGLPVRARQRSLPSANKISTASTSSVLPTPSLGSTPMAASLSSVFGTDMLNSPQFMSVMSLMGSTSVAQKDNSEFQKMVRDFYKQILESGNKYPPSNVNPALPTTLNTSTSQPTYSFASSLPAETTITPSSINVRNIQDMKPLPLPQSLPQTVTMTQNTQDTVQNTRINLGLTDLTITPARSTATSIVPDIKNTVSTAPVNTPNIYLQPISNLLATDLPKKLNPLPQTQPYMNVTNATNTAKFQPKAKNSAKNKNIPQKPFQRISLPKLPNPIAKMPDLASISPLLSSLTAENQAQLLSTYADLLKNNAFNQLQTLSQKTQRAPPKRKPKPKPQTQQQPPLLHPPTSAAFSTMSAQPNLMQQTHQPQQSQQQKQQQTISILPSSSLFQMPSFDPGVMTISAISASGAGNVSSAAATLPTTSFSSSSSNSTTHGLSSMFPQQSGITISPTKTLQQKLAERQKANQLNDAATATPQRKPSIDVIILD